MTLLLRVVAVLIVSAVISAMLYWWAGGLGIDVALFYKTEVAPKTLDRIRRVLQVSLFLASFSTLALAYLLIFDRKPF